MPQKADAEEIVAFLDALQKETWLGQNRRQWPNHIYHFTDVRNAASILRNERIYSRKRCEQLGVLAVDAADREVIAASKWAHRYARLYFGPRTPTQYWMEGIRPPEHRHNRAHCPVPVFFVFDSRSLLTRAGCSFSDGNIASPGHCVGDDASFLRSLPFRDIYHRGSAGYAPRASEITYARNAEVLFDNELGLDHLKEVVCRTGPERETLLNLLGREPALKWRKRIRLERAGEDLFERRWFYLKDITLIGRHVHVTTSRPCGRYERRLHVRYPDGRGFIITARKHVSLETQERYKLPREDADKVFARFEILDSLAFEGFLSQRTIF